MKRIVRLTENDLARIVKRVMNEQSLLMEGVPNTTLKADGPINIVARTVCDGMDYIKASVVLTNTGTENAYINNYPIFKEYDPLLKGFNVLTTTYDYNVTIQGKPQFSNPEGQNQPMVPKGKKATLNFVIKTNITSLIQRNNAEIENTRGLKPDEGKVARTEAAKRHNQRMNAFKNLKSATIQVRYNGQPLDIPVNIGGFMVDSNRACDAQIELPKGF